MGPSPGPARARPGPVHFSRDQARCFEKGLENCDFYVVKKEARQGSGWNFCEGARLGLGSRSIFKARDRPGIAFLGLDPSLTTINHKEDFSFMSFYENWDNCFFQQSLSQSWETSNWDMKLVKKINLYSDFGLLWMKCYTVLWQSYILFTNICLCTFNL